MTRCSALLRELSLPSIEELIAILPSPLAWKGFLQTLAVSLFQCELCSSLPLRPLLCDFGRIAMPDLRRPHPLISCTCGDVLLTRQNVRLVLRCSFLRLDTIMFHQRSVSPRSSTCPLCLSDVDSAHHFIVSCAVLMLVRLRWLPRLGLGLDELFDHVMGAAWIDSATFQRDIILFLDDLRSLQFSLLV